MNILFWSHGKSFTIEEMARSLQIEDDSLAIDLVQNRSDRVEQHPDGPFREIFDLRTFDKWDKLQQLPQLLKSSYSNREYLLDVCMFSRTARHVSATGGLLLAGYEISKTLERRDYDIVHFSFPFHLGDIIPFFGLKLECPAVIHFWGSDLFRVTDHEKIFAQSQLINKSQYIVAATPEMEAIVKYKFGIEKGEKINRLRMGSTDKIYEEIERAGEEHLPIKVEKTQKVVQIGYSASFRNQHKKIIGELGKSTLASRPDVCFVFPMTYDGNEEYIRSIRSVAQNTLRDFIILDDFLTTQSIAALRTRADIVVNTPFTDALNSAMTEALYAGSVVINGSWLPYHDLKRHGFSYTTVDELAGIPGAISQILEQNVSSLRKKLARENREVREYASWPNVAKDWISFYRSVCR